MNGGLVVVEAGCRIHRGNLAQLIYLCDKDAGLTRRLAGVDLAPRVASLWICD